jgi:hypothetical protein
MSSAFASSKMDPITRMPFSPASQELSEEVYVPRSSLFSTRNLSDPNVCPSISVCSVDLDGIYSHLPKIPTSTLNASIPSLCSRNLSRGRLCPVSLALLQQKTLCELGMFFSSLFPLNQPSIWARSFFRKWSTTWKCSYCLLSLKTNSEKQHAPLLLKLDFSAAMLSSSQEIIWKTYAEPLALSHTKRKLSNVASGFFLFLGPSRPLSTLWDPRYQKFGILSPCFHLRSSINIHGRDVMFPPSPSKDQSPEARADVLRSSFFQITAVSTYFSFFPRPLEIIIVC